MRVSYDTMLQEFKRVLMKKGQPVSYSLKRMNAGTDIAALAH